MKKTQKNMENHSWTTGKIILILFIFLCLIISIVFSMKSVTGYIIAEKVELNKNILSLIFFIIGIFSTTFYLSKFR